MLGSRKVLIFGIVSALVLSLLIVGSLAAEPEDFKSLVGGGDSKIVPPSSVVVPKELFKTVYSVSSIDTTSIKSAAQVFSSSAGVSAHFVYFRNTTGSIENTLTFDSDVSVYVVDVGDANYNLVVDGVSYGPFRRDTGFAFVFGSYSPFPESANFTYDTYTGVLNPLPLFDSLLGIGTVLVAFVVSRPIVLIPTVAMILVLSYGVIRRLIKGV